MSEQDTKAYDVYLHHELKRIGFQWGSTWGGLVYDGNDNIVGAVMVNPKTREYYLSATKEHHTGKQWDGFRVSVDSRPSKKFHVA